jgi:hypothetical protein
VRIERGRKSLTKGEFDQAGAVNRLQREAPRGDERDVVVDKAYLQLFVLVWSELFDPIL